MLFNCRTSCISLRKCNSWINTFRKVFYRGNNLFVRKPWSGVQERTLSTRESRIILKISDSKTTGDQMQNSQNYQLLQINLMKTRQNWRKIRFPGPELLNMNCCLKGECWIWHIRIDGQSNWSGVTINFWNNRNINKRVAVPWYPSDLHFVNEE